MKCCHVLVLSITIGVALCSDLHHAGADDQPSSQAPRQPRDRFRLIAKNVDEQRVSDEIHDFTQYGCEKMVVIRNRAQDKFSLSCRSFHDAPKATVVQPGNAFTFTFRPQKNGRTKFWCTVGYKHLFARFDVYNEAMPYMCPRAIDEVYQYTVNHDGVHVDAAKGNEGVKIRALFKGHNKFTLWEEINSNNETDGYIYSGLVDGGMCSDMPEQFNDKPRAATVCNNHCVHLYEHFGCHGKVHTVQANDDCVNVGLTSEVYGKLSAIQGC